MFPRVVAILIPVNRICNSPAIQYRGDASSPVTLSPYTHILFWSSDLCMVGFYLSPSEFVLFVVYRPCLERAISRLPAVNPEWGGEVLPVNFTGDVNALLTFRLLKVDDE
ncbi:Uncharacterized protein Rs2_03241 [Raphanus sativus]|nr:Uncharacterized protein Rs2_03241 [Raphanus sativus]